MIPELIQSFYLKKNISIKQITNTKICITSRSRGRNWQNTGTRWPDCSGAGARTCTGSDWKKGKRKIQLYSRSHTMKVHYNRTRKKYVQQSHKETFVLVSYYNQSNSPNRG